MTIFFIFFFLCLRFETVFYLVGVNECQPNINAMNTEVDQSKVNMKAMNHFKFYIALTNCIFF